MPAHRRRTTLLALVLTAAATAACSIGLDANQYVTKEEKTFPVTGSADLSLKTFDGVIEVAAWDKPEVALVIERRASSQSEAERLAVSTQQTGNRIAVEAINPRGNGMQFGWHRNGSVRFVVQVPRQTDLLAASGDGAIAVRGITGRVNVHSGDGSISASDLSGDVLISSGDGAVTADNVSGSLTISTGDGSVAVTGAPGILRAHTGDGSVNVDISSGPGPAGDWELSTGDGTVHVALPADFKARLDLHTGDGGIDARDWGIRPADGAPHDLSGTLGAGGPLLRIRTGDGGISLTKRQ